MDRSGRPRDDGARTRGTQPQPDRQNRPRASIAGRHHNYNNTSSGGNDRTFRRHREANNPRPNYGAGGGDRRADGPCCSTDKRNDDSCLPIAQHTLRKIIEEREPDQLIIALEAKPAWRKLLSSDFSVEELDAILSACSKCAQADGLDLLSTFVEKVLTSKGGEGGGQHFVTRAANLLASGSCLTSSSLNLLSDEKLLTNGRPQRTKAVIISESTLLEKALQLVEVAVWLKPAALTSPSKILLSVIETHPRISQFKDANAAEVTARITKIKETLAATNNTNSRTDKHSRKQGPRFLRGYRITGAAPGSFREMSILPTKADLDEQIPFLRQNVTKGGYSSIEDYLDIQFRLLREDYVTPLRLGLQQFRELGSQVSRHKLNTIQDVRFYLGVTFNKDLTERTAAESGPRIVLQLNTQQLGRVNWERTKRLTNGSLIGVSHDNFETIVFVTVAGREPNDLKRGIAQFELCQGEDAPYFKPGVEYSLIESSGAYFEAYKHNLAVLQMIQAENFPLARNLVFVEQDVRPPYYMNYQKGLDISPILKKVSTQNSTPNASSSPTYDFAELEIEEEHTKVYVQGSQGWPALEDTCLNPAQFKAVISAFDKELCIIQGPPGTGKTFVGLKIVEMLLLNRVSNKPLLIVCYTNHALDQFLEGIVKCTKKLVRIGGRCQSEAIESYNLRHLRRSSPSYNLNNDDLINYDEKNTRRLIAQNRKCCEEVKNDILKAELFLNQLLGRETFNLEYTRLAVPFEEFIFLSAVIDDFKIKKEVWEGNQDELEEEDGYLSDEDRGELEDDEPQNLSSGDAFNSTREQAIFSKLGSWSQRSAYDNHLPFVQFKVNQMLELKENIPRELMLTLEDRWLIYRHYHWQEALNRVFSYLGHCAVADESEGIHVNRETLATLTNTVRHPITEDDQINLVIRCLKARLPELRQNLSQKVRELTELQLALDFEVIRYKDVIGITTTGAAKYNRLLRRVGCEIIVIEEAAEILEAHLITTLNPQTKQLILIGDHQQLQPSTTVFALAKDFRMQVSLFERLLTNGLPYIRLQEQHRMRDEFLQLLVPTIYEDYFSHNSVFEYEHVRGVTQDLCFITHTESEDCEGDNSSKSNIFEARFVTYLALYLRMQGYKEDDIVILTTYSGQVFAIRNEIRAINNEVGYTAMKNETLTEGRKRITKRVPIDPGKLLSPFEGIRVTTVDNYQGEESEIIIASFVRSNDDAKIGFLSRDNRICVALSRAKKGFYCVGNLAMLAKASSTWEKISAKLLNQDCVKKGIELYCERHDRKLLASTPKEFGVFSNGGCDQPCKTRLNCGHVCPMTCHRHDADHIEFRCRKKCERPRSKCNHECVLLCFEDCGKCLVREKKSLPCKHEAIAECYRDPQEIECLTEFDRKLNCGHFAYARCCIPIDEINCEKPCERSLGCEHPCKKKCYEKCTKCMEHVTAVSPCGHEVRVACRDRKNSVELKRACAEIVLLDLNCGHKTNVHCFDRDNVETFTAKCTQLKDVRCSFKHKVKVGCKVDSSRVDTQCEADSLVVLLCGHEMKIACKEVMEAEDSLPRLTASCDQLVTAKAPCGHPVRVGCHQAKNEDFLRSTCNRLVSETLDCGHILQRKCNESRQCSELVEVNQTPCGHEVRIRCHHKENSMALKQACNKRCDQLLICGHRCTGTCQRCMQGSFHVDCENRCGKILFCGHQCPSNCHEQCSPCRVSEYHVCHHSRGIVSCMQSNSLAGSCDKKPIHNCKHSDRCAAQSCSTCVCQCDKPCEEKINKRKKGKQKGGKNCKHNCVGLCGEPCPSLCRICDEEILGRVKLAEGVKRHEARYIQLPCTHIFEVGWLDQWMNTQIRENHRTQQLIFPKCPINSCRAQLRYVHRYNYLLEPIRRNIAEVAERVFGNLNDNRISLEKSFQHVMENSTIPKTDKNGLLTKIHQMKEEPLSKATISTLKMIIQIAERGSSELPEGIIQRLIKSMGCQRQLLWDVTRFFLSRDVEQFRLPEVPEPTGPWGSCENNHIFYKQTHVAAARISHEDLEREQFKNQHLNGATNKSSLPPWAVGWRPELVRPSKRPYPYASNKPFITATSRIFKRDKQYRGPPSNKRRLVDY